MILYPVELRVRTVHQNHGANTPKRNVGGSINEPLLDGMKDTNYPFLDGQLIRTGHYGLTLACEPLPNLRIWVQGTLIKQSQTPDRTETNLGFAWNL